MADWRAGTLVKTKSGAFKMKVTDEVLASVRRTELGGRLT
jgi:hypothetical protein